MTSEVTQRAGREELNYTVLRGGSTPLLFAARSGDVDCVRLLVAAGASVNDALPDGMSALVLAAHSGNGGAAGLLLTKGADANADGIGYTALHAAILRSDLELVKNLLAHGANPNATDYERHSVKEKLSGLRICRQRSLVRPHTGWPLNSLSRRSCAHLRPPARTRP